MTMNEDDDDEGDGLKANRKQQGGRGQRKREVWRSEGTDRGVERKAETAYCHSSRGKWR